MQDYIAAMPDWKQSIGRRLDALIDDDGWFLSFRCYTQYVQVQFFKGTSLDPMPPKASKHGEVRYLDLREDDDLDEKQLRLWIAQASKLPGEKM